MNGIDWTAILGIIAVLTVITVRVGIGVHDLVSSMKDTLHDDVKIPVNGVKDKVSMLGKRLHEFIIREQEDHKNLIAIMKKSGKSHQEMLGMMKKLDNDHEKIHDHDKLIHDHDKELARHNDDIKWLTKAKADKQKRGNTK